MTIDEFLERFPQARVEVVFEEEYEGSPGNVVYVAEVVRADGEVPGFWFYGDTATTLVRPGLGDIIDREDGTVELHDRTHDTYYIVRAV